MKNNNLFPPNLVSELQALNRRKTAADVNGDSTDDSADPSTSSTFADGIDTTSDDNTYKPVVLVTNCNGIESPGLVHLVEALVREGLYNIHVCAPQSDKFVSGHSLTLRESIAVTSTEISGVTAYEVSGTPGDCVSLALSGALFSWSKPLMVISGINQGSSCGYQTFYSGGVAGARESLMHGVPSLSISLNWRKDESQESHFKDAVTVCLPLINAALRDVEKGSFPLSCLLKVEIPTSPLINKGLKITKQSMWRSTPSWLAVSANRHPSAGHFMSNQQSLGIQLAQLSRDASAAGAARRLTKQRPNVEVDSVGAAVKNDTGRMKKLFRLEFTDNEKENADDDSDFTALENGFVSITPISLLPQTESDTRASAADWILTTFPDCQ